MGDRCGMSISADSSSDETLNRGPLALLLRRQYEFPSGNNIVQFSIFFFFTHQSKVVPSISPDLYYTFQVDNHTDIGINIDGVIMV